MVLPYRKTKNNELNQGDIIILSPPQKKALEISQEFNGLLIVSNTCDLSNNASDICVVPFLEIKKALEIIIDLKKKELKEKGKKWNSKTKDSFINNMTQDLSQYNSKNFYYLPISREIGIKENQIALLIKSFTVDREEFYDIFKTGRIATLRHPWREKLGFVMGNLFNRPSLKNYDSNQEQILEMDLTKHVKPAKIKDMIPLSSLD